MCSHLLVRSEVDIRRPEPTYNVSPCSDIDSKQRLWPARSRVVGNWRVMLIGWFSGSAEGFLDSVFHNSTGAARNTCIYIINRRTKSRSLERQAPPHWRNGATGDLTCESRGIADQPPASQGLTI
jgi:hypothetical protein